MRRERAHLDLPLLSRGLFNPSLPPLRLRGGEGRLMLETVTDSHARGRQVTVTIARGKSPSSPSPPAGEGGGEGELPLI